MGLKVKKSTNHSLGSVSQKSGESVEMFLYFSLMVVVDESILGDLRLIGFWLIFLPGVVQRSGHGG